MTVRNMSHPCCLSHLLRPELFRRVLVYAARSQTSHSLALWELCLGLSQVSRNDEKEQKRTQLEYASSLWDNTVKRRTTKVEAVQRSAARITCHDYRRTTSVTTMLQKLQWDSVQQRRARIVVYWCCTVSAMDWLPFLPQSISSQLCSTLEGVNQQHSEP